MPNIQTASAYNGKTVHPSTENTCQDQTEQDSISRMVICKHCENALRFHRQYVSAVSDGAVRTVKSCNVCHTRTFCRTFDVGSLPRQTGAF